MFSLIYPVEHAYLGGRAMNNPSNYAAPPLWMMKLTKGWGKQKNNSKGEDNGFKIEEGLKRRGVAENFFLLPVPHLFSAPLPLVPLAVLPK